MAQQSVRLDHVGIFAGISVTYLTQREQTPLGDKTEID